MGAFGIDVNQAAVCIFGAGTTKRDALDRLIEILAQTNHIADKTALHRAVYEREAVMSTGIGSGVAIPHVRLEDVAEPCIAVGTSKAGIEFDSLDNKPVHVVVLFAMPSRSQREYLGLLAQVMTALKVPGFRDKLTGCANTEELTRVLNSPL